MPERKDLKHHIERLWENRLQSSFPQKDKDVIDEVMERLDQGKLRVCSKENSIYVVHEWIKQAILLYFLSRKMECLSGGPEASFWWDKIPGKVQTWEAHDFQKAGFRSVPYSFIRKSAFIGARVVLMPSFVNVGAYIDEGTMVDTWSTVGSCAQIGRNVHLSGGVGIGGVLEPLQASPVIIEDHCFIGARSEIVEGVIVEKGSVIGMGVYIGASTKIIDRQTGKIYHGRVPAYSVVVAGSYATQRNLSIGCAVIVKTVDEQTRSKTSINELLREG